MKDAECIFKLIYNFSIIADFSEGWDLKCTIYITSNRNMIFVGLILPSRPRLLLFRRARVAVARWAALEMSQDIAPTFVVPNSSAYGPLATTLRYSPQRKCFIINSPRPTIRNYRAFLQCCHEPFFLFFLGKSVARSNHNETNES